MNIQSSILGAIATLNLDGRFTFEQHLAFKQAAYELLDAKDVRTIQVDLSAVSYMDSSSLGMLLLLREKAEVKGIKVALFRPSPSVQTILKVVQFDQLFEIKN
jgi:HptB-dependent secretion and biofilm anti anti-sigma factor